MARAASTSRQQTTDVRPRRNRPEDIIQRAVFEHLRLRSAPGIFSFHPANGGARSPIEAKILKGLGVRAGVPDVIAIHHGRVYAIEIKTENGRATGAQLQAIEDIRRAGGHAEICRGLDHALAQLETWGLLRGRALIMNTVRGGIRASRGARNNEQTQL
jgi:hypothetical protein